MAKKKKGIPVIYIVVIVAMIITLGLVIYRNSQKEETIPKGEAINQGSQQVEQNPYAKKAKTAEDIKINEDDSDEVKVEKIQGKLELMNKEISKKQAVIEAENEVLSKLYEQYTTVMNETVTEIPASE